MIQIQRSGLYVNKEAIRGRWYDEYVAERRQLSTEELQKEVRKYEEKSGIGKVLARVLSDCAFMLRINASRQVLSEREREVEAGNYQI